MLKPPGSRATGGSSTRYASSRRKTMESPADQLRKIAKQHPSNKKCCDCGAKLPQCINLSVGSFICMTCSGLHREISSKIKSLGHSTFTEEEVEMMRQTNNENVNSVWLARYDPQAERSRLNRQPDGNQNQEHLRTWIRRKYSDKRWYSTSGPAGGSSRPGSTGNQQPQATVAQIPPANPQPDLFGNFDAPSPAPTPTSQNGGWDAFGGSSQQQQSNNFANFDSNPNKPPDPFAQPQPQQAPPPQQQQNFANFGSTDAFAQQQQQPPPPQQNQNFANFGAQQPSQQVPPLQNQNFANFGAQQPPPQQQQQSFGNFGGQQPPQQQQTQNFGNFGDQQPPQPQQFSNFGNQQPTPQQPQSQPQAGFANFNQLQQQQQLPPPQQQPSPQKAAPQMGGFANFNQQQAPPPQQMNNQMPSPGGFANFNQQQPPPQSQPPAAQQGAGFAGNFNPQQNQLPQPAEQQHQPTMPTPASMGGLSGESQPQQVQEPPAPPTPTMVGKKEDPMDAFAHLSVGGDSNTNNITNAMGGGMGGPSLSTNEPATVPDVGAGASNKDSNVAYEAKQVVCYKSNGKRCKAQILKKHLDDELQPYYTIVLPFGKEKQTDNAHLEPLEPAFESIESKLLSLSATQLKQVENFLSNMPTETSSISVPVVSSTTMEPSVLETVNTTSQAQVNPAASSSMPPPAMGSMMAPSANGTNMMNGGSSNGIGIPSPLPAAKPQAPSMGGIPAPNLGGQVSNAPQGAQMIMQQPPMQGQQPPLMQGQVGGQPQMMMQQQPGQMQQQPMQGQAGGQQVPQMQMQQQPMQAPQMQGQPGPQQLPQMQMQMQQQPMPGQQPPQMQAQMGQQPHMMMQQQPMLGQNPAQMGQIPPASSQGNPFDMY